MESKTADYAETLLTSGTSISASSVAFVALAASRARFFAKRGSPLFVTLSDAVRLRVLMICKIVQRMDGVGQDWMYFTLAQL